MNLSLGDLSFPIDIVTFFTSLRSFYCRAVPTDYSHYIIAPPY